MVNKVKKAVVTIDGKKYPLIFGFKFLNEINALPKDNEQMDSLTLLIGGLIDGDPNALKQMLVASLSTYDELEEREIINYLETSAEVEELFENFIEYLTSAPLLKKRTMKIKSGIEQMMKTVESKVQMDLEQAMMK
ncbi:tail assembly chaperone [Enterococcus sp. LJL51]|uniref:tail assembly chaperone n=1 Tax=Enterococcus sp. LJL51 TaxID=3416656 RepID=UPI003CEEE917